MTGSVQTSQSTNQPSPERDGYSEQDGLPAYDELSIAPPLVDQEDVRSSSASRNQARGNTKDNGVQTGRESMKQKWKALKAEDERRRANRYQYITAAEADKVTGLDKHREEEAKKACERKSGAKSILGILMLS